MTPGARAGLTVPSDLPRPSVPVRPPPLTQPQDDNDDGDHAAEAAQHARRVTDDHLQTTARDHQHQAGEHDLAQPVHAAIVGATDRRCVVCDRTLDGRRIDATTCGPACRRVRSRLRALLAGKPDGGYSTLAEYLEGRRRRAKPAQRRRSPPTQASGSGAGRIIG